MEVIVIIAAVVIVATIVVTTGWSVSKLASNIEDLRSRTREIRAEVKGVVAMNSQSTSLTEAKLQPILDGQKDNLLAIRAIQDKIAGNIYVIKTPAVSPPASVTLEEE